MDNIFHIFEDLVIGARSLSTVRWIPKADIYLTAEHLVVMIELPGVKKEDISVSLSKRRMFIEGVKNRMDISKGGISFYNLEIDYGPFERKIDFPCDVDPNRMNTNFDEGVLIIELEKSRPVEYEIPVEDKE